MTDCTPAASANQLAVGARPPEPGLLARALEAADPLNNARFDGEGTFIGWPAGSPLVGVHAYLSLGAVWRKVCLSKTRPGDLVAVGRIDIPEGNPPVIASGANWLYVGVSYEQKALTYQVRKEWRLSDRGGWNTDIY